VPFVAPVRTWRVASLYGETGLSRKRFGIGHMCIYTFLLRMSDTMTSQNIDLSSWDILYTESVVKQTSEWNQNGGVTSYPTVTSIHFLRVNLRDNKIIYGDFVLFGDAFSVETTQRRMVGSLMYGGL
jgi:hypothetical protein